MKQINQIIINFGPSIFSPTIIFDDKPNYINVNISVSSVTVQKRLS